MKIWIINHYAIPPSMGGLVRHYYFSKYLREKGHDVKIFTSSKIHNTDINMIQDNHLYLEKDMDGVPYTFVKTSDYKGNGIERIINMLQFPIRIWRVCKKFEKPDVIYTSSPDLFTAFSAVIMAKILRVKKVVEIRDLWPESIVEYNGMSKKNPVIQILYQVEKWLYRNADELIFTMAGGKKYLKDKRWTRGINPKKIHHINNGVDLEEFEYNKEHFQIQDGDLENQDIFKIIYTGSIRKVNNLELIVNVARKIKNIDPKIKFLIWGDGTEKEFLERKVQELNLDNISFKGKVEKRYIPYILSKADVNLMQGNFVDLFRYGCSPNKLFDYFAAGRPILSTIESYHDLVRYYKAGMAKATNDDEEVKKMILELYQMPEEERENMGNNAIKCARNYSYEKLTNNLEKILSL